MTERMKILVTNDDGYNREGLKALVRILRKWGDVTVVAPKTHQSGMSMAVTMSLRPIAVKKLSETVGERWWYLDGTPASCVKFGIDNVFLPEGCKPDLVVSGINYGGNYATAALYSGTIGAAMEAAVNSLPGIGVSLDNFSPDADFSAVEEVLPPILEKLIPHITGAGRKANEFYNINIPNLPACEIKGIKASSMGFAHWENEYRSYDSEVVKETYGVSISEEYQRLLDNAEEGEDFYYMAGDFTDNKENSPFADHHFVSDGYISITAHNIDNSDPEERTILNRIFE